MAAPNIVNVSSILGKTAYAALTTTTSNVITNAASSGEVRKINNLILANGSASAVGANVTVYRSGIGYTLAGSISVPSYSSLVLLGRDTTLYLEEGDVIQANATANSAVTVTSSYEVIS